MRGRILLCLHGAERERSRQLLLHPSGQQNVLKDAAGSGELVGIVGAGLESVLCTLFLFHYFDPVLWVGLVLKLSILTFKHHNM